MTYQSQTQDYLRDYIIQDPKEQLLQHALQTPFIQWCLESQTDLSDAMVEQIELIFRIRPELKSIEKQFLKTLDETQQNHFNLARKENSARTVSYEVLLALGYSVKPVEESFQNPISYMERLQQDYQYKARGLYFNDKGKLQMEANTFARYLASRLQLAQTEDGITYRYNGTGAYIAITKNVIKKLCRDVLNEAGATLWNRRFETEYMGAFEYVIPFVKEFDENPDIINFKNGLFNMKTFEFNVHTADYPSTNQLEYEYDPEAKSPKFQQFLEEIFERDDERVRIVRQMMGYLWLREIKIHKVFIFIGNGANGKSVLAKIIHDLLGQHNVASTSIEKFEGRFGLQDLPGKLVNISSENEFTKEFNTENLKQVTSGDALTVERKYRDAYSTTLYAKLIMLLNDMMDSRDTTDAYFRRLQIIPCNRKFVELRAGEEPLPGVSYMNPNLVDELKAELPGIFNYAMEGLQELVKNNFKIASSKVCDQALIDYQRQQKPVIAFVDDCIEYVPGERLNRPSIAKEYELWNKRQGIGTYRKLSDQKMLKAVNSEIVSRGWVVGTAKIDGDIHFKNLRFKTRELSYKDYVTSTI